ncbi:MAG: lamin tail domain-containing protein, partial [Planctomycetales bacterium]|nr:lamin tail domain-containing protein [Planctomycetales bacterium]
SPGRMPNGTGRLAPLSATTFGAENTAPRVGPVIISEVQYNPKVSGAALAADPTLETSDLEYISLTNTSASEIDLTEWRVRGGIDFEFDPGTKLASGETVRILRFNPANPEQVNQVNAFKAHYGLDDTVRLLGGYGGQLNNSDDRISLLSPDDPPANQPNAIPRPLGDEVLYDDLAPWPTGADGTGRALVRTANNAFGNFASSWVAGDLPPGLASDLRGDFDGNGTVDATDIDLLTSEILGGNPNVSFDLTNDQLVNSDDRNELIHNVLGTSFGDSNLDGIFNSTDLVLIFTAAQYEDSTPGNSTWATGDWNGDGDFTTSDLVAAFQEGAYSAALRSSEPTSPQLLVDNSLIGARLATHDQSIESLFSGSNEAQIASEETDQRNAVELIDESFEEIFAVSDEPLVTKNGGDKLFSDSNEEWFI